MKRRPLFASAFALITLMTVVASPVASAATTKVTLDYSDFTVGRIKVVNVNDGAAGKVMRMGKKGTSTIAYAATPDTKVKNFVLQNQGKQIEICARARVVGQSVGLNVGIGDGGEMRDAEIQYNEKNPAYQRSCNKRTIASKIDTDYPDYGRVTIGKSGVPKSAIFLDFITMTVVK